tara:strand:+ start:75 stop:593 length:519 start_codon:yes stop_codon:yes gene_type:complete
MENFHFPVFRFIPRSNFNLEINHSLAMASRWNVLQNKPKKRRRTALDLYEFCTFLVFISLGSVGLMILLKIPSGTFDHVSDERNGIVGIGFLLSGWALIKFDSGARRRANEKYNYDLAEYELIRTKFLEMEAAKLEMQKEYSMQYMNTGSNNSVIINPGTVEETEDVSKDEE